MLNPYDSLDRMLLDSRRVSMGEKWFLGVFLHGVGLFFVVSGPANVQAYSYRESVGAPVPLRTGKPLSHGQGQAWLSMKQMTCLTDLSVKFRKTCIPESAWIRVLHLEISAMLKQRAVDLKVVTSRMSEVLLRKGKFDRPMSKWWLCAIIPPLGNSSWPVRYFVR